MSEQKQILVEVATAMKTLEAVLANVLYDLNKNNNIMISLSSSERAPTLGEVTLTSKPIVVLLLWIQKNL